MPISNLTIGVTAGSSKVSLQSDLTRIFDKNITRNVASFSIKKLFDRAPPFFLHTVGGGHQVGYDPPYIDQLGRIIYLKGSYSF